VSRDKPARRASFRFVLRSRSPHRLARLGIGGAAVDNSGMLIREAVTTSASPERLWQLLSDPMLHGQWNPHIVSTEALGSATPCAGNRYRITYELNGRRSEFDAEITEFMPPSRWAARMEERTKGDGSNFDRYMVESYVVSPRGTRHHICHDVRIHNPGINIFLRALIWVIQRIGKPTGPTIMQRFAQIAEGDTTPMAA
jgi:uncharacterized protein YndB with AHSA1/START domain